MSSGSRKWWLCVAPATVCAFDAGLTLVFQPDAYWAGRYDLVNEFSPIDRWMLVQHPLAFVAWVGTWITAVCLAIRFLPTRAGMVFGLTLVVGNTTGASWWVGAKLPGGFWLGVGLFLSVAGLIVFTWGRAGVLRPPAGHVDPR